MLITPPPTESASSGAAELSYAERLRIVESAEEHESDMAEDWSRMEETSKNYRRS